jgi:hypothetical protein
MCISHIINSLNTDSGEGDRSFTPLKYAHEIETHDIIFFHTVFLFI